MLYFAMTGEIFKFVSITRFTDTRTGEKTDHKLYNRVLSNTEKDEVIIAKMNDPSEEVGESDIVIQAIDTKH